MLTCYEQRYCVLLSCLDLALALALALMKINLMTANSVVICPVSLSVSYSVDSIKYCPNRVCLRSGHRRTENRIRGSNSRDKQSVTTCRACHG